jgi:hypothetical protein
MNDGNLQRYDMLFACDILTTAFRMITLKYNIKGGV